MCPACLTSIALVVASGTSAGGLTALVIKKLRAENSAKKSPREPKPKEKSS
jgi:uncharacterized protein YoaH (UPF0181 family)